MLLQTLSTVSPEAPLAVSVEVLLELEVFLRKPCDSSPFASNKVNF